MICDVRYNKQSLILDAFAKTQQVSGDWLTLQYSMYVYY